MNPHSYDEKGFRQTLAQTRAATTVTQYAGEARRFFLWVNAHAAEFEKLNAFCVNKYLNWLRAEREPGEVDSRQRPIAQKTYNVVLSAIKAYFAYIGKEGKLHGVKLISAGTKLDVENSTQWDDVKKLLDVCRQSDSETMLLREVVIRLLYKTGLRISELLSIRMEHLDMAAKTVRVRLNKKRGQEDWRTIFFDRAPFTASDRESIGRWLDIQKEDGAEWLICSPGCLHPPSSTTVRNWLKVMARMAGMETYPNPHSFRHGHTKDMLAAGTPMHRMTSLMHWKDERMVMEYARESDDEATKDAPVLGGDEEEG